MLNKNPNASATLFRRGTFLIFFLGLAVVYLFGNYRGITHQGAMEQAQIAREIARGNGLASKVVRPRQLEQMERNKKEVALTGNRDTYHAPAYPMIIAATLKIAGADDFGTYKMGANEHIYAPDRILAGLALLFFSLSIGASYALISKLFDAKIAATTAVLMLFSELMWKFVQTSLPQMFMLFLFTLILWITWDLLNRQEQGQRSLLHVLFISVLFGLLALTHWITLWIFIGYLAFAMIYFKPRGVIAAIMLGVVALMCVPTLLFYHKTIGMPFGLAASTAINGLMGSEEALMRSLDPLSIRMESIMVSIVKNCLAQLSNILLYLGGIVVAPLFFLTFMHKFKRDILNSLKIGILLMWVSAVLGMGIFSLNDHEQSSNQLHILFIPLLSAYGVAFVTVLWARMEGANRHGILANVYIFVIVLLSAGPLVLKLPRVFQNAATTGGAGKPNTPYYHARALNRGLYKTISESDRNSDKPPIIFSDQPHAVAWYADTHAVWLPWQLQQLHRIEEIAEEEGNPISGIHTSGVSTREYYEGIQKSSFVEMFPLTYSPLSPRFTGSNVTFMQELRKENSQSPYKKVADTYDKQQFMFHRGTSVGDYGHDVYHTRYNKRAAKE